MEKERSWDPSRLPQQVFFPGAPVGKMREGIGVNVFLGRERYYPPTCEGKRWKEIGALMDELRPGFLRIGYLEGTGIPGDVTPWDDARGEFLDGHDLWAKLAWFDAWCVRNGVHWMLDPWWVPRSMQVPGPEGAGTMPDPSGKMNWRGAPANPDDYADRYILPLVDKVRRGLGLRNMRWLGIFNEPVWGKLARDPDNFFVAPGDDQVGVLAQTYAAVRRSLDKDGHGEVGLIGPGHLCSWQFPPLDFMARGLDPSASLAAWDMHAYFHQPDWMPEPVEDFVTTHALLQQTVRRWVDFASQQGKPFFITEMGTFFFGRPFWGDRDFDTAGGHAAAIHDAQFIVRGICEGVDGFLRWALCVDPEVDGRWGLIEWDGGDHPVQSSPHVFPVYRALMHAIPPRSTTLAWRQANADGLVPQVHGCGVLAPDGTRRIILVHDRPGRNADVRVVFPADWIGSRLSVSRVDASRRDATFPSLEVPEAGFLDLMIVPQSVTTLKEIRVD